MACNMRPIRVCDHAVEEVVVSVVSGADFDGCSVDVVKQVVGPRTSKTVISVLEERTNMLGSIGEWTVDHAVVDTSSIASNAINRIPHLRLEQVSRVSVKSLISPGHGAGVIAFRA